MAYTHILLLEVPGSLILPFDTLATMHSWQIGSTCVLQCSELTFGETNCRGSPLHQRLCGGYILPEKFYIYFCWASQVLSLQNQSMRVCVYFLAWGFLGLAGNKIELQTHTEVVLQLRIPQETFPLPVPTVTTQSLSCFLDSLYWWADLFSSPPSQDTVLSGSQLYMEVSVPPSCHIQIPKTLFPVSW